MLAERWTLLVIRELLWGEDRFNAIARGLPRISPSLLAARLRELQLKRQSQPARVPEQAATMQLHFLDAPTGSSDGGWCSPGPGSAFTFSFIRQTERVPWPYRALRWPSGGTGGWLPRPSSRAGR
ncbi:winged helix-turn-helix transcriptional regulator [Nonomuraea sp. 3N208]|uniref:winged helix-turn-helix transcriptional regulator n=1 Tax=Nonomuraea sp. 3N208 TaxID=3457421 RepID=UPI003FD6272C